MRRRIVIAAVAIAPIVILWAIIVLPKHFVGVHQRSVMLEFSEWKAEYSTILSRSDAVRTAGMIEYVQGYYVPGDGYHSTPDIETALQSQRKDTVDSFVWALQKYTNVDFGTDTKLWIEYLETEEQVK